MRSTVSTRALSWRRTAALVAVAAVPIGILAANGPASAFAAPGSPLEVFIDSTGNGTTVDAIQNGWWGYEGAPNNGTGTLPSFFDLDFSDPDKSIFGGAFGDIRVAFVPTSSTGTAEHPVATAGQTVDQVFGATSWFMDAGYGTALSGTPNPNDGVAFVSTGAEFDAWFAAGQPTQGFDNNLVVHDVNAPGSPVATKPMGKSILNRWTAGSNISLVFYQSTGANLNGKPVVKVGPDGKAITAYMPFTTVAKPSDASRSSAGYTDLSFGVAAVGTSTSLGVSPASPQQQGTPITLTATVTADSGPAPGTGSVEFFDGSTSLGSANVNASGVASLPGQLLSVGSHTLKATYSNTAGTFTSSTSSNVAYTITPTPATGTTTAAAAVPGATVAAPVALSATVSAADSTCPAGSVAFKEGGVTIASDNTPTASCVYDASYTFASSGSHTVTAVFTPTNTTAYAPSQGSVTFSLAADTSGQVDEQTIVGVIPAGTITVTTPYTPTSPLNLGTFVLTGNLSQYTASKQFDGIHVVDTRSGARPWALTALAGALLGDTGGSINGQNVGLTGLTQEAGSIPGGTITITNNPAASPAVQAGAGGSAGLGGTTPHPVLNDTSGPSDVTYHGLLTVNAPTNTPSGLYTGTITFTVA